MRILFKTGLLLVVFLVALSFSPVFGLPKDCRILVVMSYEENFVWVKGIKEGIDSVLSSKCTTKYFYMNTRDNFAGGKAKAKEAYEIYKSFAPHGVLSVDDNAQSMFVVPYLKNKVKTPVMFCGVDANPAKYGFPAANVSGILQRIHILETLIFLKQLVPSVEKAGFIMKSGPTGQAWMEQVKRDTVNSPVEFTEYRTAKDMTEALSMIKELRGKTDALFIGALQRIRDKNGNPLEDEVALPILSKAYGKPIFTNQSFRVKFGALCAVVDLPSEQGSTAAEMLLKALSGTPVSKIPITQTQYGRRVINITTMKALGIKPTRTTLVGAELVE